MIRLDLTDRALAHVDLAATPIATLPLGNPLAMVDLTPRPLALLSLPVFPAVMTDNFLQAGAAFLEAGSERLEW